MTREEFIGKLRSIYVGEENAIDEIISKYDRVNNNLNELSDFAIKIYQKELDKTSDWWLQEELKISFDDINLATNFRLEEELKENNK